MSSRSSPLHERMIFNIGARRSETLWLQRIVAAHPDVTALPSETHLFSAGIAPLMERFQHAARASPQIGAVYADRATLIHAVRDLCDVVFADLVQSESGRVAERTPQHARHLDLIYEIYPDARFVHIIRDGRDVARSIVARGWGPSGIADAAREWRTTVASARAARIPADRYLEVRYERLLADPESEIRSLYEWLSLPVASEVLDAALAEARAKTNVTGGEVGTGKWRRELSAADRAAFGDVAGNLLDELGYDADELEVRARPSDSMRRRLRAGARAARSPLRRERAAAPPAARQAVVDALVAALQARDTERLAGLLTPNALVRVVGESRDTEARGERARRILESALAEDDAFGGPQLRGDVYPSDPTTAVVLSLERPDGSSSERLVLVTVDGQQVSRVAIYRLPLSG